MNNTDDEECVGPNRSLSIIRSEPPSATDVDCTPLLLTADEQLASIEKMRHMSLRPSSVASPVAYDLSDEGAAHDRVRPQREWRLRRKHFFVVSSSGRPVYTRYGDECEFADLFGIIQVMVAMVEDRGHMIRRAQAGKHQIVFLKQGELVYVIVSCTGEPYSSYIQQLKYLHHQIESIIPNVDQILKKKQGFDLRRFMGEAEISTVRGMIHALNVDPSYYVEAVHPIRVAKSVRLNIASAMNESHKGEDHIFTFLLHRRSVVQIVSHHKHVLHPADVLLLLNHVDTSPSILHAETWLPLCLPRFSAGAFLWIYVDYLEKNLVLVQVSTSQDLFPELSQGRDSIKFLFEKFNVFRSLREVDHHGDFHVSAVGIAELRHVIYVVAGQYVTSTWPVVAAQDNKEKKRILRAYAKLRQLARNCTGKDRIVTHTSLEEGMIVQTTKDWDLFLTFSPSTSKVVMTASTIKVRRYLKSIEEELFLVQK